MTIIFINIIISECFNLPPNRSVVAEVKIGFATPHSVGECRCSLVIWTLVNATFASMVIVYVATMCPAIVGIGPASFSARCSAFTAFSASLFRAFTSRLGSSSSSGKVADALFQGRDDALLFECACCGIGRAAVNFRGDGGVFEVR